MHSFDRQADMRAHGHLLGESAHLGIYEQCLRPAWGHAHRRTPDARTGVANLPIGTRTFVGCTREHRSIAAMLAGFGPVPTPWRNFPCARLQVPDRNQSASPIRQGIGKGRCQMDDQPVTTRLASDPSGRVWHQPVMLNRIVELLSPALASPGAVYVDATLGMAGHAAAILTANPAARLVGIDQDPDALVIAGARLAEFGDRVRLVRARFDALASVLAEQGVGQVWAILLDLGLSSLQIDKTERGFAYAKDAPLDMRMDPDQELSAADVVNDYPVRQLADVFRKYGEEPYARPIAAAIGRRRTERRFTHSADLVDVVAQALPAAVRYSGGHLAKRVFQGLRIEVNGELDSLSDVLPVALDALAVGGRMAVLSYHSLEDRLVKRSFMAAASDDAPAGLPVVPQDRLARFVQLTRGAEKPSAAECERNPRAKSARLRAVQRIRAGQLPEVNR